MVDNGFYSAHQFNPDKGKLYENVVFLHLRRVYKEIFYYKGKQEVDFCFETQDGIQLINVSYDLSNRETKEREINGLCEAMEALSVKESLLIMSSLEEIIEKLSGKIKVIPLYKWLLQWKVES